MNLDTTRSYLLSGRNTAQTVAYALAEYLDAERNMITQTMRTRNGYVVQCKGDATAEWTKYLGMNAAVSIDLRQENDELTVVIGTDKWAEKIGIAAVGSLFFAPLMFTAGVGALRQFTLPEIIFEFIEGFLDEKPITRSVQPVTEEITCPNCGASNKKDSLFCRACGTKLEKEPIRCSNCGAELDGDEDFCPYCGHRTH